MANHLIVVVNRVKARFFVLEPIYYPQNGSGLKIVEVLSLLNYEGLLQSKEFYTDLKPNRRSTSKERENHLEKLRQRFSAKISARICGFTKTNNYRTVIVAPSAKMRRFIYPHLDILALKGISVYKVPKNMINFSPVKIHNLLANYGLTPKQKRRMA
jgi:hypothetical protein